MIVTVSFIVRDGNDTIRMLVPRSILAIIIFIGLNFITEVVFFNGIGLGESVKIGIGSTWKAYCIGVPRGMRQVRRGGKLCGLTTTVTRLGILVSNLDVGHLLLHVGGLIWGIERRLLLDRASGGGAARFYIRPHIRHWGCMDACRRGWSRIWRRSRATRSLKTLRFTAVRADELEAHHCQQMFLFVSVQSEVK